MPGHRGVGTGSQSWNVALAALLIAGGAALAGARRLSFTTSGRSQGYALTLLLGVLVMAAWLLVSRP